MKKLSFLISRALKMDRQKLKNTLEYLQKKSGRSKIWLIQDMLKCSVLYGAGYTDYKIAEMYRLNSAQRKSTITRGISNDIVRRMNDKAHTHFFDDKSEFDSKFSRWVDRPWLRFDQNTTKEELQSFLSKCSSIFVKPLEGSSGVGVHKLKNISDTESVYKHLKALGDSILEQTVVQHEALNRLYPGSVNTVRVATLLGDKQKGMVYAFLRIGNGGEVDNVDCGGMACRVDIDSGCITTPAADKQGRVFDEHPITGTYFEGFEIPYFKEIKQMCLEAMEIVPEVRYVAWDVCITPDGPRFIEGNSFPSHAVPQFAAHYKDGIGILTEFRKFIDC
ncbi:MAG: sugar-transfer associated ATP-grasp domain-containing protein [Eubacteriales bacterium]|nr:sugar-transfer associated ATP-grasp domain-containing protein [Eubacteriales bacterium]